MLLAEGRLEFVAEFGVKEYDIAALVPIITEAGGRFTSFDGERLDRRTIVARDQRHPARLVPLAAALSLTSPIPFPGDRSMTIPLTRLGAALVLALTAALATACAATPPAEPDSSASAGATPKAPAPDAVSLAEHRPRRRPRTRPATRSSRPTTIADFESIGWTSRTDPFYIGDSELSDGLQCVWADFEGPAGDHLQMFGWAPITADAATKAEEDLVGQGWRARKLRRRRLHHREP